MFASVFVDYLQKNNLTAYKVAKETGISQGLMNQYKNGVKTPTVDNLLKISNYLNCSVDYLLGISDDPSRAGKSLNNLSANELTIIELFSSLSDTQQGELIGRAKMMIEQNEEAYNQEGAV